MKFKKLTAALTAMLCCASTLAFFPETVQRVTAAEAVANDFEINYGGWYANGVSNGSELQAVEGMGWNGSRGMVVTGRTSPADGAQSSKGFYLVGGVAYTYNVQVMAITDQTFHLSVLTKDETTDEVTEQEIAVKHVKGGEWTNLSAVYTAPENSYEFQLTLTTDSTDNFAFDEVRITSDKPVNTVSAAASEKGLKDAYANYFRVGNILNGMTVRNSTITATFLKDYNAIECENETKPDATLVQSGSTDSNIKVSLASCAAICEFAAQNNLAFRGHTLVWHSQSPEWFFKQGFNQSANWVDANTMNKRMESYIKNMFNAFKTQYPDLNLYAYDVCNECVSDDANRTKNNGGARMPGMPSNNNPASPWVAVYGDNSFVEKAFTYARQYAPPTCKLFYNDYNEYWDHKRDCIYNMCKKLYEKGLLDGVGMQSHINADRGNFSGTEAYVTAMKKYLSIGCDVQISELDITCEGGKFSATDQANKYKDIFQAAVDWNKNPQSDGRVTLVQIWGPNDANTWIKTENSPLLYDTNNQPKAAYNALMQMIPQSDWGDYKNPANGGGEVKKPEPNEYNWWFNYGFESGTDGFESRGGTTVESSSKNAYVGSKSMYVSGRTETWAGANYSLSSRTFEPGQEYSFSAHVMYDEGLNETEDIYFSIQYEDANGKTQYDKIDTGTVEKGKWMQLSNTNYKIPEGASNVIIYFETADTTTSFYVDEVIAAVAGTGIQGEGKPKVSKPQTYLKGDVDGDGVMDIYDLGLAKQGILKGFANKVAERCADIDENGTVEIADIIQMTKFLLGEIREFQVVEKVGPEFKNLSSSFSSYKANSSWKAENENNPLTTQRFGADPGWLVYDGRLYIYTTNDALEYNQQGRVQENTYNSGTINCVSTADMVNWTDHGPLPIAARNGRTQNGCAQWASAAWAPDACWKMVNGKPKFFLYFANSGGGIGVVTSDSPSGPFKDELGHALLTHQSPNCGDVEWMFDPGVYYDEKTDEAYLFFGGGRKNGIPAATPGTGRVVKLGSDMMSIAEGPNKMETPYLFEDSSVIKIGDTWYYSYCANWDVGQQTINGTTFGSADICYMTSKNPMGPWTKDTFSGMVFANTGSQRIDAGGNNHHSIIYFKNKYYVAYHSRQQALRMEINAVNSKGEINKDGNYRSTQINEAHFDASTGKITCKGDMTGVKQIETLNPYQTVGAETMNNQSKGITVQGLGDTQVVAKAGEWTKVSGVEFKGTKLIRVKASSKNGAVIRMSTGKVDGPVLSYIEVPAGGSLTEIEAGVSQNLSGTEDVYFSYSGDVVFDSWVVE